MVPRVQVRGRANAARRQDRRAARRASGRGRHQPGREPGGGRTPARAQAEVLLLDLGLPARDGALY
jgi:hypothetical protein